MSWFPNFLNPLTAAVAAGIVIPALLILYFLKLRRREMPISSTLLWKKAIQDLQVNAPFQKLRRNLLLLLQLLLLIFLLLALSRPVVNYTPGAGKMSVVLIDRSASMSARDIDGKTRLDEAKRRAKELVETLDKNGAAMVIAFDDQAEIVQRFTSDIPALKNAIDSIQPTDRKSRLKTAYQLAEAQTAFAPEQLRNVQRPHVRLYSDGRVLDPTELRLAGDLKYEKIGTDDAGNVAIVALSAKRNYERPAEVQIFARLANFGPEPVKSDVQLNIDGKVRSIVGTTLLPQRWTKQQREDAEKAGDAARESVEFNVELNEAAVIHVEQMNKLNDALTADDVAQVVVPPPKALSVLLVTDGDLFLENAMKSLNLRNPQTLLPSAYEEKLPSEFDVIIFHRYSPKALPPAGNFVFFGCIPPDSLLSSEPPTYVPPPNDADVKFVGVLDWQRDHPMLRHLNFSNVYFANPNKLQVPPEAEVLIDGRFGPLLALHRDGASMHLVCAGEPGWGNWAVHITFPYFMYNAMQFMAVGSDMDVRESFAPGASPSIPRANLEKLPGGVPKEIAITGPGGTRKIKVPKSGELGIPKFDRVGLYTLDPPVPQFDRLAVNLLDENESNLLPVDKPPGDVGEAITAATGKSRLELWWWLVACAALPLLLIEWWVYTRRVHL